MNYDRAKEIDDNLYERQQLQDRIDALETQLDAKQDKLVSATYILTETLERLHYSPAMLHEGEDCVGFVEELIDQHGGDDGVVNELVAMIIILVRGC